MGVKTRGVLIQEALEQAGNTSLAPRARQWLDTVMVKLWASAPWRFAQKRFTPTQPAGTTEIQVGDTITDGPDSMVQSVKSIAFVVNGKPTSPIDLYLDGEAPVSVDSDLSINNPGIPEAAVCSNSDGEPFVWRVRFDRPFSQSMKIIIDTQRVPEPLSDDDQYPLYPNDETIIAALKAKALFHQEDPRWIAAEQTVYGPSGLVAQDMVIYLQASKPRSVVPLARVKMGSGRRKSWLDE